MSANMYDAWDCGDRPAIRAKLAKKEAIYRLAGMTRDDIIRMAREAGLVQQTWDIWQAGTPKDFERFAALVAAAERDHLLSTEIHSCHADCQRFACVQTRRAVEAEREACAKLCEQWEWAINAADAIRARGEKP